MNDEADIDMRGLLRSELAPLKAQLDEWRQELAFISGHTSGIPLLVHEAEVADMLASLDRFIEKNYGPRCPTNVDGCPVCEMWAYRDWFEDFTS